MSFSQAVGNCFNKYLDGSGRASRSEYWYWVLFALLVSIGASVFDYAVGSTPVVGLVASIALLAPGFLVGVRRLHDTGRSAWHLLWVFVPIFGPLYEFYLMLVRGDLGTNQYGPPPGAPDYRGGVQPSRL